MADVEVVAQDALPAAWRVDDAEEDTVMISASTAASLALAASILAAAIILVTLAPGRYVLYGDDYELLLRLDTRTGAVCVMTPIAQARDELLPELGLSVDRCPGFEPRPFAEMP